MKTKFIKYSVLIIILIFSFIFVIFRGNHNNDKIVNDPLCGPKSLLKICELMKIDKDLDEICELTEYDKNKGTSMLNLYQAAVKIGLPAIPTRIGIEQLCNIESPAIAFVNNNHFIVVLGSKDDKLILQNPPDRPFMQSIETFKSSWNGETLLFSGKLKQQLDKKLTSIENEIKGPRIKFNNMYHDFGIVNEGDKLKHSFSFTNIGTSDLEVYARSSCSCTVSSVSSRKIAPGKTGEVTLELNTTGKKGQTGETVFLKTNDPANQNTTLTISCLVEPSVKVVPEKIWLDEITADKVIEREILIVCSKNGSLSIEKVETPSGITSKVLPAIKKDSRTIPVQLTINAAKAPGNFDKKITIHTNDVKRPVIEVMVSGIIVEDLKAYPPVFLFGEISHAESSEREIIITSSDKRNITSLTAESGSEYINLEVKMIDSGKKYSIIARLNPPHRDITIKDNILVYLNKGNSPVLKIPLYGRIHIL